MTIKQRIKDVKIVTATGERTVQVRRLLWKQAKAFIQHLIDTIAELYRDGGSTAETSFFTRLPALVASSDTLVTQLITNTTSLTPEEIEALDFGDVLALIDAALEINLDDETKNFSAGIAAKVRGFVAAPKTS